MLSSKENMIYVGIAASIEEFCLGIIYYYTHLSEEKKNQ